MKASEKQKTCSLLDITILLCLGEPAIRSRYARLTVLVAPEPPKIIQGNFLSTTEDSSIKLECISVGGKPPAEVRYEKSFQLRSNCIVETNIDSSYYKRYSKCFVCNRRSFQFDCFFTFKYLLQNRMYLIFILVYK